MAAEGTAGSSTPSVNPQNITFRISLGGVGQKRWSLTEGCVVSMSLAII
jgi:hypothetical protein